ncbi:MAG: antitoxin family protein [Phormidesmis sp. CAN_BIN44]|nr:antitoxin family protein [Phormidesmis sp. CAN_BIN44]
MAITVQAVYEDGVLRLIQPISLAEGTQVEVVVMTRESKFEKTTPAAILSAIAALPLQGNGDEFSGREYDRVFYPQQSAE